MPAVLGWLPARDPLSYTRSDCGVEEVGLVDGQLGVWVFNVTRFQPGDPARAHTCWGWGVGCGVWGSGAAVWDLKV